LLHCACPPLRPRSSLRRAVQQINHVLRLLTICLALLPCQLLLRVLLRLRQLPLCLHRLPTTPSWIGPLLLLLLLLLSLLLLLLSGW